ncbi:hypothetical protein [Bacillus cereus]|uniref:hypothetical protein n=1 Tax=Bacillus cereus TaxID=1396 RepID=UPI002B251E50|nr:hypothetical protein [Bacillus cereus]MEB2584112.1 hypothetical protein [Bacillus cereus]MEB2611592.1 hypothetical protein [Bacillus cereus]
MKYHELFNTLKSKQVAKREFQEEFSCNVRIIAIFFDGEHYGSLPDKLDIEYDVIVCNSMVHKSEWGLTKEYNEHLKWVFE